MGGFLFKRLFLFFIVVRDNRFNPSRHDIDRCFNHGRRYADCGRRDGSHCSSDCDDGTTTAEAGQQGGN